MSTTILYLNIRPDHWEPIGDSLSAGADPKSRMLCSVLIYGGLHHIDAIEITRNDDDEIRAANDDFEEQLDRICNGFDPGDQYEPVTIDGREYLLFMDPGC